MIHDPRASSPRRRGFEERSSEFGAFGRNDFEVLLTGGRLADDRLRLNASRLDEPLHARFGRLLLRRLDL